MSNDAAYLRILATIEPRTRFSIEDIRGAVDAAQLTKYERGELFRFGVREGYLTTRHQTVRSALPSRKHARNQLYTRTRKAVPANAREVA